MARDDHEHDNYVGDIEQQNISGNYHQGSSPKTTSITANIDDIGEIQDEKAKKTVVKAATVSKASTKHSLIASFAKFVIKFIVGIVVMVLAIPLCLLLFIGMLCLFGDFKCPDWCCGDEDDTKQRSKGVYMKTFEFARENYNKTTMQILTATTRLGCLSLLWLVLNLCVTRLSRAMLLGSFLWKWSLFVALVFLGHPIAIFIMVIVLVVIYQMLTPKAHDYMYYLDGLIVSISLLLHCGWVLLAWMLYFDNDVHDHNVCKYITWSIASLLVGAILWVLIRVVILQWEAKAVYTRFKGRILMAGFQLFFLSRIVEGIRLNELMPWIYSEEGEKRVVNSTNVENIDQENPTILMKTRRSLHDDMMSRQVSLGQLLEVCDQVISLAQVTQREDDDIFDIVKIYQQKIGANNKDKEYLTEEEIREWIEDDEEAELLMAGLKEEYPSKNINEVPFLKWMVDAHKNCVSVGYTLVDAHAMINILNAVLTICLVVVVILFWLLVTGLATTKVLVAIASPFLALTFVFGDTCKTFFQGVIFSFVTHPFDIGDRCIVNGVEVEVKHINILTTTCTKIGTKEKLIYPNSDLATKLIVNLEGKPDPNDVMELFLDSSTKKSHILELQKLIENFLDGDDQRHLYEKSCRVVVKEMRNNIKLDIHFKHAMSVQDVSHMQFFEKKNTQRSIFFLEIKQILEDLDLKVATP